MGDVVPFVLGFNTAAGLAYVVAGVGLWLGRPWAFALSLAIFAATLLVFAGFGLHVAQGGAFELRTVFAMALRGAVWGGRLPSWHGVRAGVYDPGYDGPTLCRRSLCRYRTA